MRSFTRRLVVIAAIAGAIAPAAASAAPAHDRAAVHGYVCGTDYSRNSVTGEHCVPREPYPVPDVVAAAPSPSPRAGADHDFSWPHAGVGCALAAVLLAGAVATARRRRIRLAAARRGTVAAVLLLGLLAAAVPVAPSLNAERAEATPPGPNGSIAFRRYLGPDRTRGAIFTVAPDGSGERQVTRPPRRFSDDYPDFAPDGSIIAFERCGPATCRIYTVRPDGTDLRAVGAACTGGRTPPACSDIFYPALSPDGTQIAYSRAFGRIRNDTIAHVGIYVMRSDGTQPRQVTLPPTRAAEDIEVQWSPDGTQLVFTRYNVRARPRDRDAIFVVNVDGTGLRRITPWRLDAGDGPDWSPDGSRILFRAPTREDFLGANLHTVRPDGTDLQRVTDFPRTSRLYSASFSPDGGSIVLGRQGLRGAPDVFTMRLGTSALTPLTRTTRWDSAPDWGGRPAGR